MEDYIKYLFLAVAIGASLYKNFKKQKRAGQNTEPEVLSSVPEESEEFAIPLEVTPEPDVINKTHRADLRKRTVVAEQNSNYSLSQTEFDIDEEEDQDVNEDFDLKKAVIYSEILNPPYI